MECLAGLIDCENVCVSFLTDVYNCGYCGTVCLEGGSVDMVVACVKGLCGTFSSCPIGLESCGPVCYDLLVDSYNCGECGLECTSGSDACMNGICVSSNSTTSSIMISSTAYTSSSSTSTKSYPTSSSTSPTSSMTPSSSRITGGAAAGLGIGCTLLGALLAGLVFFILLRRKRQQATFQQQHLPSDGRERDAVELTGRGITNEQPIVAEPGEGHTLQEKQGVGGGGAGHGIRQKAISKIRGWPGIRDRHTAAELDPHDAVHIPDN